LADRRVVVTGIGAVTPLGENVATTWAGFIAGRSGVGPYTLLDPEEHGLSSRAAAEVAGWQPLEHFDRKEARRLDRVTQFARVAARQALMQADLLAADGTLDASQTDPNLAGAFIGSGLGGVTTLMTEEAVLRERGGRRVSPFLVPMMLADSVPGSIAIAHGLKGPNLAHISACASGANAIGEALEAIRRGVANVMVAGGSEAAIVPVVVAGFETMGALSSFRGPPEEASRPFDAERDGFVMGEGCGVLILEELEHALSRGAEPLAEFVGYGSTADAEHITAPAQDGDGIRRAIHQALAQARRAPADISYINAHGTSTPLNDAVETIALKAVLGPSAYDVPVSSNKSMIGHLLGAGGAVEAVATVMTIGEGLIPPTINLRNPDPACDLDYVPEGARRADVGLALSTSLGFGGHNAALLFARYEGGAR
jgi:3-oxoacyl-[acyl-carrier-protein] synthase II